MTHYHVLYFAQELSKRFSSDNIEKFSASIANAKVDLNPHQVEAALFAFKSPLSKGALLADEVGLGRAIEAGLVISQKWIVICSYQFAASKASYIHIGAWDLVV